MNTNETTNTTVEAQESAPAVKTSLIDRLLNTDKDAKVREACVLAIEKLGTVVTRGDLRTFYKEFMNAKWADAKIVKNKLFQIGGDQHRGYYCLAVIHAKNRQEAKTIKRDELKKFEAAQQLKREAEAKAAEFEKQKKAEAKAAKAAEAKQKASEPKKEQSEKKVQTATATN